MIFHIDGKQKTVTIEGEFTIAEFLVWIDRLFPEHEHKEYKIIAKKEIEYIPQPYPYPIYPEPTTPATPWYGYPIITWQGGDTGTDYHVKVQSGKELMGVSHMTVSENGKIVDEYDF